MKIIETENLSKYYGKNRGIDGLNLSIEKGEIFGFIGPNGAGKSTTIRTLLGFLKPTSGKCRLFGNDLDELHLVEMKKKTGYLPSEVEFYENMTVKSMLGYFSKYYGKDCKKRVEELVNLFELDLNKNIRELSYGNRKKAAIVQCLMHGPELLILDEPTGGLDPLMQKVFFDILKNENKNGTTIFFSSHILSEVQKLCDRVGIIKDGKILEIEEIEKVRKNNYKKIRLEFRNSKQGSEFMIEGVSDMKKDGNTFSFFYNGDLNELIKKIGENPVENFWMEEPDLEEIFMNYYRKEN